LEAESDGQGVVEKNRVKIPNSYLISVIQSDQLVQDPLIDTLKRLYIDVVEDLGKTDEYILCERFGVFILDVQKRSALKFLDKIN